MLEQAFWPESRLLAGVNRLAQTLGCELLNATTSVHSLKQYAESLGVEALSTQTHYGDLQQTLRRLVPGVVAITYQGKPAYVFISGNHRHQLELQLPNGGSIRCGVATLAEFIREDRGYKPDVNLEAVLVDLGLQGKRLARAKQILLQQQLAGCAIAGLWLLRPHANLGLKAAATYARLGHYVLGFTVAHIAERTALIAGVSLLGYAITHGQWAASLVITWLLIMLTCWVFGAFGQACQVQLEVRFGLLIKRQLQQGAMQLSPEALANKGPAQLLGQAMEADGLQNNALPGVFTAINAAMDMLIGLGIALFLQQWLLSGVLVAFIVASSYPVVQFGRAYRVWAKRRTQLSHLTIEHMQGNRTRLMQSGPSRWHKDEERQLHYYWLASVRMDRFALWLQAIIPCLWLMCASAILCVAILFSQLPMAQLAALLGVILLVWQAWRSMADSCQQLARTWHSWQEIKALLSHNGPSSSGPHTPNLPSQSAHSQSAHLQSAHLQNAQSQHSPSYSSQEPQFKPSTLVVNQVAYAYAANKPILQSVDLHLQQGRQYLLQGESGSGKSTLLALLAGQASPQQGWLLCNDRDLPTLGDAYWRKKICWVPQYHDNYLFSATLLFNLLLGRTWPPTQQDVNAALSLCDTLGLSPLLHKMPAGILQSVGEMGWQLSQGERSRIFLARALLQNPDFLLLDESLSALDAATSLRILEHLQQDPAAILLCMHP